MKVKFLCLAFVFFFTQIEAYQTSELDKLKAQSVKTQTLFNQLNNSQLVGQEKADLRRSWQQAKQFEAKLFQQLVEDFAQQQYVELLAARSISSIGRAQCERIEPDEACIIKAEKIALAEAAKEGGHYLIEARSKSIEQRQSHQGQIQTSNEFSESLSMTVKAQVLGFKRTAAKVSTNKFTSIRQAEVSINANVAGQNNPKLKRSLKQQVKQKYSKYLSSNDVLKLSQYKVLSIGPLQLSFVNVPAGKFKFGSVNGSKSEQPLKPVSVPAFLLGTTEVTEELYNLCIKALVCSQSTLTGELLKPVNDVSWYEITNEFIPWLSAETGYDYRLPTELEWEYAAKLGRSSKPLCQVANGKLSNHTCDDGYLQVADVASLEADNLGLYDMLGNVAEWTDTCWRFDHNERTRKNCHKAAIKGGSWYNNAYHLRPSARFGKSKNSQLDTLGFRLILIN